MTTSTAPANGVPYRVGPLLDTRVLKAHCDAAHEAVREFVGAEIHPKTAEAIAARILSARDSDRPRYVVVLVLENSRRPLILGPFATPLAATKAVQRGLPLAGKAGIYALVPWPRLENGQGTPVPRPTPYMSPEEDDEL
ncbi:MAG: hypothetical protein R2720_00960 [Candidatus Nanopelagicales bacterium]